MFDINDISLQSLANRVSSITDEVEVFLDESRSGELLALRDRVEFLEKELKEYERFESLSIQANSEMNEELTRLRAMEARFETIFSEQSNLIDHYKHQVDVLTRELKNKYGA